MKKYTCFILMLCLLLTCLFSCGNDSDNKDTDAGESVYEKLQQMVGEEPSSLTVRIKTDVGGDVELQSEYKLEKTSSGQRVSYTVQQMSGFTGENGELTIPEERVATLRGEAVVSGGRVVSQSGDTVDTDLAKIGLPHFDFDESNFANVSESDGRFSADVTSPARFMGSDGGVEDMTVEVIYTDRGVSSIRLCYGVGGFDHQCEYIFA